ncbi:MAG: hypothetical protein F6J97_12890 [Leptolyngbya sp. SIO4C1]|nr:hypothetical protein [Leptolyngbya sp. SIO4C1]
MPSSSIHSVRCYQKLLERISDPAWLMDEQGRIQLATIKQPGRFRSLLKTAADFISLRSQTTVPAYQQRRMKNLRDFSDAAERQFNRQYRYWSGASKKIVLGEGGQIWLENQVPSGCKFYFT